MLTYAYSVLLTVQKLFRRFFARTGVTAFLFMSALFEAGCSSGIDVDTSKLKEFSQSSFFTAFETYKVKINNLLFGLTYLIGLGIIFSSLMQLKKFGQRSAMMQSQASLLGPICRLFLGVIVMYLHEFLNIVYQTTWGENVGDVLDLQSKTTDTGIDSIVKPMAGFIQFIGLIAVIRGFMVLQRTASESGNQPGQLSKGFTHIVGGVFAINILGLVHLIEGSS
jgi:intracellular multiplication protein IcmC